MSLAGWGSEEPVCKLSPSLPWPWGPHVLDGITIRWSKTTESHLSVTWKINFYCVMSLIPWCRSVPASIGNYSRQPFFDPAFSIHWTTSKEDEVKSQSWTCFKIISYFEYPVLYFKYCVMSLHKSLCHLLGAGATQFKWHLFNARCVHPVEESPGLRDGAARESSFSANPTASAECLTILGHNGYLRSNQKGYQR